jgi:hypothetical protein
MTEQLRLHEDPANSVAEVERDRAGTGVNLLECRFEVVGPKYRSPTILELIRNQSARALYVCLVVKRVWAGSKRGRCRVVAVVPEPHIESL